MITEDSNLGTNEVEWIDLLSPDSKKNTIHLFLVSRKSDHQFNIYNIDSRNF